MPQDKRVYIWYESCDCDITTDELVYDGTEICLWSDTGELAHQWDEVYNFSYCDNLEEVQELE